MKLDDDVNIPVDCYNIIEILLKLIAERDKYIQLYSYRKTKYPPNVEKIIREYYINSIKRIDADFLYFENKLYVLQKFSKMEPIKKITE